MFGTQVGALILVLLVAHASCAEEVLLPKGAKVCRRSSPDFSSCLRLALQESWMLIVKGFPEYDMPGLDPHVVDFLDNTFEAGDVLGRFVLRNATTYGLAKTNFLAVRPNFKGNRINMEVDVEIPKVFMDGYYKAEGSIGPYKVGGKGYFNMSLEGISATWNVEGQVIDDRWVIEHFHIYPEVEGMKVYFSDMFNGDDALNKMALTFVNQYWQVIYKAMLPYAEKEWDKFLTNYVNEKYFSKLSVSKLFPE